MLLNPTYYICEICKKPRSKGNHNKCSRKLQIIRNEEEQQLIRKNQRADDEYQSIRKSALYEVKKKPFIRLP